MNTYCRKKRRMFGKLVTTTGGRPGGRGTQTYQREDGDGVEYVSIGRG